MKSKRCFGSQHSTRLASGNKQLGGKKTILEYLLAVSVDFIASVHIVYMCIYFYRSLFKSYSRKCQGSISEARAMVD